jgi:hypothetical protein
MATKGLRQIPVLSEMHQTISDFDASQTFEHMYGSELVSWNAWICVLLLETTMTHDGFDKLSGRWLVFYVFCLRR